MPENTSPLPSIDALLRAPESEVLLGRFGRTAVTSMLRDLLSSRRSTLAFGALPADLICEAAIIWRSGLPVVSDRCST